MKDILCLITTFFIFSKKKPSKKTPSIEEIKTDLIARFVITGNGKRIGESVTVNNDILIVKDEDQFVGIPLKHIDLEGKRIIVKGLFDKDKALELADSWRKSSYKEINYPNEDHL